MAEQQPPTQQWILEQAQRRQTVLSSMHDRMRIADEWIHADEDPSPVLKYINKGFPPDFEFEIFPYGWTVLNRGYNQVATAEVPQVTYELPADFKKRNKGAEEDEKAVQTALQGILYQAITRATENPITDAVLQMLGLGEGGLYYPYDEDAHGDPPDHGRGTPEEMEAWEAYEQKCAETLPWRIESLHPIWILPDTEHDPPWDFIIKKPVDMAEMARRFPKLGLDPMTTGGSSQTPPATYLCYVSEDYYAEYVNGEAVTENGNDEGVAPNGLGHVFVQNVWAGFGKKDEFGRWDRRGVGLIQRGIGTFRSLTFNKNWLKLIKLAFIPKLIATGPTVEKAQEETQDIDPTSGAVASLSDNIGLRWLESPGLPPALMEDIQSSEARLEQIYGPGILSGQDTSGSEPASKWAARTEAARGPYRTPKKNSEQMLAVMLGHMLWDIKYQPGLSGGYRSSWEQGKGKQKQRYSVNLKPSQIHPGGKITVDMSPQGPDEKAAKIEEARALEEAGWIGPDTAAKMGADVDDLVEEQAQRMAGKVMEDPNFIAFLTQQAIAAIQAQSAPQAPIAPPAAPPIPPEVNVNMPPPQPVPVQQGGPLPPGVPQEPPPPMGSMAGAMQGAQSAFRPPQPMTPAGAPQGY